MKKRFGAMIMVVVLLLTITACEQEEKESGRIYGGCSVHYIDVGQGDAALIQAGDTNSLIDTGTNSHYDELSAYLDSQNVEKLDNLIITHPDADHMGGAYAVIADYGVEQFYTTNTTSDSQAYQKMIRALKQNHIEKQVVSAGDDIDFGEGAQGSVLGPIGEAEDSNESSLVIRLDYGENSYLFTGDTTARMENRMNQKYDIDVDVLKASHHGSDTANGVKFIRDASPIYSVISVGADNNYGHPDYNVLRRLKKYSTQGVLRTDKMGNIVISSNGEKLSVESIDHSQMIEEQHNTSQKKKINSIKEEIIGNKNTKVYHSKEEGNLPDEENRMYFSSENEAKKAGYRPCSRCYP